MIYFDNAATSFPKPAAVVQAVNEAVRFYGGNPGRSGHQMSMRTAEKIYQVRQKAGAFFDVRPEQVIFTLNCTHALNQAIKGVMAEGGHVITTRLEHNSVLRPLESMAAAGRIQYTAVPVTEGDDDATLAAFGEALRRDTRAVVCTHGSNVTGTLLPVSRIADFCRRNGLIFILDAAQTAGVLPVRLSMGPDIICMAGHKSLHGITGTGLMLLREGLSLPPLMEGGTGTGSLELQAPAEPPERYEVGTVNTVGIIALGAALDDLGRRGLDRIYRYEMALCARVYEELRRTDGVQLLASRFKLWEKAPIVSFNIRGLDAGAVAARLSERGFLLRGGYHCAALAHPFLGTAEQGAVRFSPGIFNNPRQVTLFLDEVKKIAKNPAVRLNLF